MQTINETPPSTREQSRPEDYTPRSKKLALALICAAWVITLAINAPGHLSFDSIVQLEEGRSRTYAGFHPPIMSALLGIFDNVVPGTSLYLVFSQGILFGSLIAVILYSTNVNWNFYIFFIPLLASPLIFVYEGIIWKDVLFANLSCAAFSFAFLGEKRRGKSSFIFYVCAAVAAILAGMMRQNGLVIPLVLGSLIAFFARRLGSWRLLLGAAIGAGVFVIASWTLNNLIDMGAEQPPGSTTRAGVQVLLSYDIEGMVANNSLVASTILEHYGLDAIAVQDDARRFYSPDRLDWLASNAKTFNTDLGALSTSKLVELWVRMVLASPITYLHHRIAVFRWMLWPPDIMKCLPIHVGIAGPPDLIAKLGLAGGLRPQDRALYAWSLPYFSTPLFRHGFFSLLGMMLVAFCLWRRRPGDAAAAAMLIASGLFTISWLFIGIACDFRYMYFLPLSVITCLALLSTESKP